MDIVGHRLEHALQELRGGASVDRIRPYFGHMEIHYRGLAKSRAQLLTLLALGNRLPE